MDQALKDRLEGARDWIGRSERASDVLLPLHVAGLGALLDRDDPPPQPGDDAPPGAHWLIRPAWQRHGLLGPDGHPARGEFLPPVPLPRRMWAGSRITFRAPLRVGDTIERRSEIADVAIKGGRHGALVFVTVRHAYRGAAGPALDEEQDIVYRDAPGQAGADAVPGIGAAPADGKWRRTVTPDPVMLFRYSALTYNGHRIHYDYRYVTAVEGYPGLVVHGPLLATLLLDLVRRSRPETALAAFAFRAVAPVFDTAPFVVTGGPAADARHAAAWIRRADGALAMRGEATFAA